MKSLATIRKIAIKQAILFDKIVSHSASLECYHYSMLIKEEAARLDWSVRHDRIEHVKSYAKSIVSLLQYLINKY
jgi:hypothetical protein